MIYTATLIDWKIEEIHGAFRLRGTIAGIDAAGRFESGDVIFTSPLENIDFARMEARTKNSFYKLSY